MNYLLPPSRHSLFTRFFNDPTDLLFRDFFDTDSAFNSLFEIEKINYPVNIKQNENSLEIDVAVIGLDKKDIKIEIKDNNILSILYDKKTEEKEQYIYKGITNKSFSLAWKISNKFNLSKLEAKIDRGLLKISIPISPENKPKEIEIKD